ncbi:MAG: tRNA (adenosine(37)-N6)-threonylcarbamoyltransferase complex dimerization subunit type 1 TsaB [Chitinophagaceae bacterium]
MNYYLYMDFSERDAFMMLGHESGVVAYKTYAYEEDHAKHILSSIDELLNANKITLSSLKAIALMNGPGSYTGLRIALSTAKGFCYAFQIPLICFSKLDLMAQLQISKKDFMVCLLPARQGESFACIYTANGLKVDHPFVFLHEDFNKLELKYSPEWRVVDNYQIADNQCINDVLLNNQFIHSEILKAIQNRHFADVQSIEPFYIKQVHINKINKL